jgi:hypothetical protein
MDMKYVRILFAIMLVFTISSAFSFKKKNSPSTVYAFGVSASFTDSVIYFTDIQVLDSAKISKEGFLSQRELYSYQLKNYMISSQLQQNSTCMIYFSANKTKLEKESGKLQAKYKKDKTVVVSRIDAAKFSFTKPVE